MEFLTPLSNELQYYFIQLFHLKYSPMADIKTGMRR